MSLRGLIPAHFDIELEDTLRCSNYQTINVLCRNMVSVVLELHGVMFGLVGFSPSRVPRLSPAGS